MKKMIFLMLTLMVMGVASVNAQVKIGGDGTTGPAKDAVLELDGAQGALLLPRVDTLSIATPTAGMQVYRPVDNKVYTYDGKSWKVSASDVNLNAIPGTVKRVVHVYLDTTFTTLPKAHSFPVAITPAVDFAKSYALTCAALTGVGDAVTNYPCYSYFQHGYDVSIQVGADLPLGRFRARSTVVELY
jgi:hypothetical protein